ncbi:MAG: UDP-N-acetylmuramoyl-tripeptide--D-alanyl-D-alanine ligase [Phycisphaeraceae bacterium]
MQDTVKALQDLAHAYRGVLKEGGCKVIGIAGSNGKTTTRHLIHHVLTHAGLKGTQSPKSFNNHLGVPLTLLSGKPQDDFVACEIGTNHPGEIDFLSAIARPDIAVITSIGEEHLAFFKDLDGVIEEELSIGEHLPAGAYCIVDHSVPRDHPAIRDAVHRASRFAGGAGLLQHILNPNHTPSIRCSFLAAWTALSVGVRAEDIRLALRCVEAVSGRWERLSFNHDVLVINDAYNANPSSVKMAIGDLDRWDRNDGRKVVVLGDMHELGERAMDYHCEIGRFMLDFTNLNDLITIGPMAKQTFQSFVLDCGIKDDDRSFDAWSDDLPDKIADLLQPGDTVLLKASRGMRLERLIPAIERRFGQAPPDEPT